MAGLKNLALSGVALAAMSTVAMAADLSAPYAESVAVSNPWDAYVSVGAGYTWFDSDAPGANPDDWTAEIRSSASYQFDGGFGLQSDVVFNYQSLDIDGGGPVTPDFNSKNVDTAFHAFWRNESFLVGAFGQYGLSSVDPGTVDFDRYYVGGEAQAYFGNATLYVQGGYQGLDSAIFDLAPGDIDNPDGFFINGELRYFVTDNFKLAVNGGYETLSIEGFGLAVDEVDFDTFKVGGSAEYRFDATPLSAFIDAEYRMTEIDADGAPESDELRVLAGLKLNLGTQTLLERDRSGATLDPVRAGALGSPLGIGFGPTP